jgi:hypothetical protein
MAEQQEKRARGLDEVRKRKEYLIAHGIDKEGILGFGTVEGDQRKEKRAREAEQLRLEEAHENVGKKIEDMKAGMREAGSEIGMTMSGNIQELKQAGEKAGEKAKKWFGIW